jgi:hypothetical protein
MSPPDFVLADELRRARARYADAQSAYRQACETACAAAMELEAARIRLGLLRQQADLHRVPVERPPPKLVEGKP